MALTPLLAETGAKIAKKIEENMGLTHYLITETVDPFDDTTTTYNDNNNNNGGNNSFDDNNYNNNDDNDMNIKSKTKRNININNNNLKQSESKSSSGSNQGEFVFICGYGKVGQIICEMLDRKFIPYIVIENSPQKAIEARNKGLPVYFGK